MSLISEVWNVKNCSEKDKRKKMMLICSGPPLDYYMYPLGWAGKVNFTGLLGKHVVKSHKEMLWPPCEGHGSSLPFASVTLWQWGQSSTHLALNWRHWVSVGDGKGGTILPECGDWITDGRVCAHVCVWAGVDTHTCCTSLSWLWEYVCVGQVHQDPSINRDQIRPAPLLTRG